ncbi:dehydration-responsive element-binding protein 1B-like [Euphorbia lathyris]|uniref:dehydration-responsive element-binding protein 1B-like n=1 Tax=Euphorbia lathyris TaxID=212925 RepID=UPI003313FF39
MVPDEFQSSCSSLQLSPITIPKRKAGRKKFQETRHPVYNGVRQKNGKWVSELRQPYNKGRIWLGTFSSPQMAAKAYDVAALALRGDSAALNFPKFAHLLSRARSSSVKDIQSAAIEAANQSFCGSGGFEDRESEAEKEKMNVFMDYEELFNMPILIDSMAEGLILTPPAMKKGFTWDDGESNVVDLTLWSE